MTDAPTTQPLPDHMRPAVSTDTENASPSWGQAAFREAAAKYEPVTMAELKAADRRLQDADRAVVEADGELEELQGRRQQLADRLEQARSAEPKVDPADEDAAIEALVADPASTSAAEPIGAVAQSHADLRGARRAWENEVRITGNALARLDSSIDDAAAAAADRRRHRAACWQAFALAAQSYLARAFADAMADITPSILEPLVELSALVDDDWKDIVPMSAFVIDSASNLTLRRYQDGHRITENLLPAFSRRRLNGDLPAVARFRTNLSSKSK